MTEPHETQTKIALIQRDITDMQEDVRAIRTNLEGNGKVGLLERTAEVERVLATHLKEARQEAEAKKETKADKREISTKIVLLLIGSIIAQLVSTIFNYLSIKGGTP